MRKIKKLLAGFLIFCAAWLCFSGTAKAAGGSIRFSDPEGETGGTVDVTVRVTSEAEPIGTVQIELSYDASALEFEGGGNASGGSGTVRLVGYGDGQTSQLNYSLSFKVLKEGAHKITVASCSVADTNNQAIEMVEGNSTITAGAGDGEAASDTVGDGTAGADDTLSDMQESPEIYAEGTDPAETGGDTLAAESKEPQDEGSLPGPFNKLLNYDKLTLAKLFLGAVLIIVVLIIALIVALSGGWRGENEPEEEDIGAIFAGNGDSDEDEPVKEEDPETDPEEQFSGAPEPVVRRKTPLPFREQSSSDKKEEFEIDFIDLDDE